MLVKQRETVSCHLRCDCSNGIFLQPIEVKKTCVSSRSHAPLASVAGVLKQLHWKQKICHAQHALQ